jgi:hypothetical protein
MKTDAPFWQPNELGQEFDLESAIVQNLASGDYTAIVRGVNNTTGVALHRH